MTWWTGEDSYRTCISPALWDRHAGSETFIAHQQPESVFPHFPVGMHVSHRLLPGLKLLAEEVADPECREVAGHSYATLLRIETEAEEVVHSQKHLEVATQESLLVKLAEVGKGARAVGINGRISAACLYLLESAAREWGGGHTDEVSITGTSAHHSASWISPPLLLCRSSLQTRTSSTPRRLSCSSSSRR